MDDMKTSRVPAWCMVAWGLLSASAVDGQVVVRDHGALAPGLGTGGTGYTAVPDSRFGWDIGERVGQSFTLDSPASLGSIWIAYNDFEAGDASFRIRVDAGNDGSFEIDESGVLLDSANFSGAASDARTSPVYWMEFDLSAHGLTLPAGASRFWIDLTASNSGGADSWPLAVLYQSNATAYAGGAEEGTPGGGDFLFAVTALVADADEDGISDTYELANTNPPSATGLDPALDDDNDGISNVREFLGQDAAGNTHGYGQTRAMLQDTDGDGLNDAVEITGSANAAFGNEGTDPTKADTDGDGIADGEEVMPGLDGLVMNPNQAQAVTHLFGIDFNRNDELGSPSQTFHRVIAGSANDASANPSVFTKTIGAVQVEVSRPDAQPFEFRGGNGDASRAIPGGDTSLSFLVADFIGTRTGRIDLTFTGLPAGSYLFRSSHLEPLTGATLGFAQGATTTEPNTFELRHGGSVRASVQPTALGSAGLNTTFINDSQIPQAAFAFSHDGTGPLTIELHATESNGADRYLFLNGFEMLQLNP
ncbi:MAG: hypothetical protein H7A51_14920 [Akkermansiaceae bacterium]|nr:hypothetical protein [Akkermansiaceae bacterium]